ncbi:MAG: PEGA domain-containing protein [Candidatus Liptonbacteria bacterium]|nr:PEGA domain-containing protein [Candidatus Liptonbacteria bacterium]
MIRKLGGTSFIIAAGKSRIQAVILLGKRLISIILFLVFLILGLGTLFYSQGWRINFKTLVLTKVGAIYVRSYPSSASIELDGRPIPNDSWLFDRGTLINNLYPKTYQLRLTRPGYQTWLQTVSVQPMLVAEAKSAVLVPTIDGTDRIDNGPTTSLLLAQSRIATRDRSGSARLGNQLVPGDQITDINPEGDQLLIRSSRPAQVVLQDLVAGTSTDLTALLRRNRVPPDNFQFRLTNSRTAVLGWDRERIMMIIPGSTSPIFNLAPATLRRATTTTEIVAAAAAPAARVAWATYDKRANRSVVTIYDIDTSTSRDQKLQLAGQTAKLTWANGNRLGILQTDGDFFWWDIRQNIHRQVASDGRDIFFSPDGRSVAVLEHNSLEVFTGDDPPYDYFRFNLPDIQKITRLTWYQDQQHLYATYPDRTVWLDLLDASLEHFLTVTTSSIAYYETASNRLYYLADNQVRYLQFPK